MYVTDPPEPIRLEVLPTRWVKEYYKSVHKTIAAAEEEPNLRGKDTQISLHIPEPVKKWVDDGSKFKEWEELQERLAQTYAQEKLMPDLTVLSTL